MTAPGESARLAALLPDAPRFVETRWMLLQGRCEVLALQADATNPSFVARDEEERLVCVVGTPAASAILDAVARNGDGGALISMPENVSRVRQALPGREARPAALHRLGDDERLPEPPEDEEVRLLTQPEELLSLPPGFRAELRGSWIAPYGGERPPRRRSWKAFRSRSATHHGRMNAYSEDLRKKIVEAVFRRGIGKSEAARAFGMSLSSVKRYARAHSEGKSRDALGPGRLFGGWDWQKSSIMT